MKQNADTDNKMKQYQPTGKGDRMSYRFRVQHSVTQKRKTLTIKCADPVNIMAALAFKGWIVQIYYEV